MTDKIEQSRLDAERVTGITIDPDVWRKSQMQQILASEGRAENQCPCGSYTTSGAPPVLHRPGCPHDEFPLIESSPDDGLPGWWA